MKTHFCIIDIIFQYLEKNICTKLTLLFKYLHNVCIEIGISFETERPEYCSSSTVLIKMEIRKFLTYNIITITEFTLKLNYGFESIS